MLKTLMNKILCFGLFLSTLSFSSFANEQDSRIENAYRQNDKTFDIDCYYFNSKTELLLLPQSKTKFENNRLTRNYKLLTSKNELKVNIEIAPSQTVEGQYRVEFENGHTYLGEIKKNFEKGFYLKSDSSQEFDRSFEISQFYCKVNFAYAQPVVLNEKNNKIHLNVHPHDNYDFYGETLSTAQVLLDDKEYKSYVLLEEKVNGKGNFVDLSNFLRDGEITDLGFNAFYTQLKIPSSSELVIAPAGYNRFEFEGNTEIDITYTGGYHNYCIWNSTRSVITGLFRSNSSSKLNITYLLDGVVAYRKGIIPGLSFKRGAMQNTRLLRNIIKNDLVGSTAYFKNYFDYFTGTFIDNSSFGGFEGMFKTLKVNYNSPGFTGSKTLLGSGNRNLEINFNYK